MSWVSIWLRGLVMGAADAVPGVSGGTVAFLTGIYERWLVVLTSVTPELWPVFRKRWDPGLVGPSGRRVYFSPAHWHFDVTDYTCTLD